MIEAFSKVSEASKLLLEKGLGATTGIETLAMVGHALGVHRAYIFENRTQGTYGRFITDMRYGWAEPPTPSPLANPVLRAFSFRDFAPGWVDMLEAGMVVACPTRDAPPMMRELLERQGTQSVLMCPINPTRQQWWGMVAFEDCRQPRGWKPEEVSLLKSLSRAVAASVRHGQMRSSLDQVRNSLRQAVSRTASGR
ncbi:GAF domain-containing protein [Myxococcus sp. RHSTA-1-4]|uniref:GAF domain-containing protein n=1 Tax=Myxococcus sp. RHSTA-1-4 TaxID=2874601 RepID=UPI001CBD03E0|nr:GAF domain-containing protein [Myxococcus sp. RHSTA-1-4]MBZ4415107.1 GAF domain-containing protein [Myxococcus sp. RHSTA-1-4]